MSELSAPEILERIRDLADVDKAAHALRKQLGLYPDLLKGLDAKESAAKAKEDGFAKGHAEARERRRKAELEIKSLREQVGKYLGQQNQVKTQKEFDAVTHEIQNVKARIDEAENAGLEALEAEERNEADRKTAAAAREKLKAENDAERARIAKQIEEKKSRLSGLEEERGKLAAAVPVELQETYALVDERHPGEAVAKLEGESCGGCGYTFPKHVQQAIRHGEGLTRCPNCSRWMSV